LNPNQVARAGFDLVNLVPLFEPGLMSFEVSRPFETHQPGLNPNQVARA
jgi:hypothetical protein